MKKFLLLMLAIILVISQLCFAKELNTNSDKLENVFGIDSSKQQHKNGLFIDENNIYENPSRKRTERLNKVINEKFDNYEKINTENKKQNTAITDYERSLFKKTDNLILNKQYNEAIIVLDEIITLRPNDEIALYTRGFAKFLIKDYIGAVKDFNSSIETKAPIFPEIYSFRAFCYMQLGQYQNAINDFEKSISNDPNNALDYLRKGLCYLKIGNKNQAIRDFFKAAALYDKLDDEDTKSHDNVIEAIYLISKDFKGKNQKISSLYPEIDTIFESKYNTKNGYYIFYIHPTKWDSLDYECKISLIQKTIFYSMFQELLKKQAPLYFIMEGDIKIKSSIDGTDLITRSPKRGKRDYLFKDVTLQEISENFRLTTVYVKKDPVSQDEILNTYIDKVNAIFDCEMPNFQDGMYYRSFSLKVNKNGKISQITLNNSPWKEKIDDKAIKIIRSLEPFPSIPVNYKKDFIEIPLIIRISLDDE